MKRRLLGVRIGMVAGALAGSMSLTGCGRNTLPPEPASPGSSAAQAQVRARLARKITFHAEGERFFDVLERLSRAASLNICASTALLSSRAPDAPADPPGKRLTFEPLTLTPRQRAFQCVTLHARQKAAADVLDALCMQLDLRWVYPDPAALPEMRFGFISLYPGGAGDDD